jgi:diketogulonate reductase-like aldo/keto reductase
MLKVTLNDGNSLPWLAFGTGSALYEQDATDSVRIAIENGITHLDGAQIYGNEKSLGVGIKATGMPRSDLYITTKLHTTLPPGKTVKDLLSESLENLGVDYVDLFLVHSPGQARKAGKLKELWNAMELVCKERLTKSIGVSNFQVEDLKEILDGATIIPAVNQVSI